VCIPRLYNWEKLSKREKNPKKGGVFRGAFGSSSNRNEFSEVNPRFACHRVGGVDRDGAEREREKDSYFFLFFSWNLHFEFSLLQIS